MVFCSDLVSCFPATRWREDRAAKMEVLPLLAWCRSATIFGDVGFLRWCCSWWLPMVCRSRRGGACDGVDGEVQRRCCGFTMRQMRGNGCVNGTGRDGFTLLCGDFMDLVQARRRWLLSTLFQCSAVRCSVNVLVPATSERDWCVNGWEDDGHVSVFDWS